MYLLSILIFKKRRRLATPFFKEDVLNIEEDTDDQISLEQGTLHGEELKRAAYHDNREHMLGYQNC